MFSSSEFTQYFIGQPIGVPIVTPKPPDLIPSSASIAVTGVTENSAFVYWNYNNDESTVNSVIIKLINNYKSTGAIFDKT